MQIILASASPRRRELLGGMGVRFEVVSADVREHDAESSPHLAPADLARENARRKAEAVAALRPGHWVLGADTVVAQKRRVHRHRGGVDEGISVENRVFGKPESLEQAREY